jgi:CHAT domain-containing protein
MSSVSVIHLHSHVHFNTDVKDPLSMAVVLADGQRLTARQLLSLELDAWLVLLIGCESSRAQTSVSDDLMGFVPVLQLGGVKMVIGTLFEIGEEDALEMSISLHEKLQNRGDESVAKILRSVVLEHRRRPGKEAPYHWASFLLHGDWT